MTPANGTAGEKWNLRLYTAGQSPKSLAALDNLKRVCEEHLPGRYSIEVVDLLKNPRLAKDDWVLVHDAARPCIPSDRAHLSSFQNTRRAPSRTT